MTSKNYLKNVPVFRNIETAEEYAFREPKKKNHIKPVPQRKVCCECGFYRVKHHHHLCDNCWQKLHYPELEKDNNIEF